MILEFGGESASRIRVSRQSWHAYHGGVCDARDGDMVIHNNIAMMRGWRYFNFASHVKLGLPSPLIVIERPPIQQRKKCQVGTLNAAAG